ncbi:timeless-domain-containing protein [Pluteus cervinus]|uniref:Timeless-domain-containing protein n=1 Tax=Pluteus cervinus TaxID=181527 RepID=A0ACD3ASD8_9AGAR|nr:timeless-domain-containing protein [Pluteus cervinus]
MADVDEITSSESEGDKENAEYIDRRALLEPAITSVVDALGGYEDGLYRMGDEVAGCLRDLKMLWRKDDTDDERTVARIFWETRVLPNDLIPILLATAGQGLVEDKRAVICADLITAMTWPIDMAEELKELDEELDKGTDYTQLLLSHLHYKAALLKPGVIKAFFGIMLPPLAKSPKERKVRDGQVVNVVLHLIRNLAFIKDLRPNSQFNAEQAELSSLQSKLIKALSETHTFQLLLTIAANTENDPLFNSWNTLILEIFYLLFRGVTPSSLAIDQTKQPAVNLQRLLASEAKIRQTWARKANSRHSRFGTTIAVTLNPNKKPREVANEASEQQQAETSTPSSASSKSVVLHRQQAISSEAGSILDITKKQRSRKGNLVDELAREDNLSVEARSTLQNLAVEFVEACFNVFLCVVLKDIKSERIKITEKDNLRLLYVTNWFLEFFLAMRANEKGKAGGNKKWVFGLIAEIAEGFWIDWVLKRMREAVEEKPKQWTELQAGIQCLTQLLLLIDNMSSSDIADTETRGAAVTLQGQLIYHGDVLDIAIDSLRSYKEGTQSLAYLDCSVYFSYALLRLLEKSSKGKGDGTFVRQKKARRKAKKKAGTEGEVIPDVEDDPEEDDEEDGIQETFFEFEEFEMKFANAEVTHTLLTYLARYKEFSSSENMRRVVSLMHRQAVKAKAEGLFFKVSTLDLFKTLLSDQDSFPREQAYKDLVKLINYVLRQFFKALAEQPFLAVEAFFPKNRGHWKQFSSWEPEQKTKKESKTTEGSGIPQEVAVKKGHSWSDQLGIAIAALTEDGNTGLVLWTKDILQAVIDQRKRIVEESESKSEDEDGEDVAKALSLQALSPDTLAKFQDYVIPYLNDDHANAATKNARLKLLFRLCKFSVQEEEAEELQWFVPANVMPAELQSTANVIDQFLETPFDLQGKKASQFLGKKSKRRRRRRSPSPVSDAGSLLDDDEDPTRKKKREKKTKEKEVYKSAQFIQDSDDEYGDMDAFLEKEKALRERMGRTSEVGRLATMKATGTKKRRRRAKDDTGTGKKKHKADGSRPPGGSTPEQGSDDAAAKSSSENSDSNERSRNTADHSAPGLVAEPEDAIVPARPRPRPRLQTKASTNTLTRQSEDIHAASSSPSPQIVDGVGGPDDEVVAEEESRLLTTARRRNRLIVTGSDEEDEM